MKNQTVAVILAGGLGTRLSEETLLKPKPMVEIGNKPILWHIMKTYSFHGINDFIICCGYKGEVIKNFFLNYAQLASDISINFENNQITYHKTIEENWKVTLIDTGSDTMTGGRLLAVKDFLPRKKAFCFTYGDGVGDINIQESIEFHYSHGKDATITVARPEPRFGHPELEGINVLSFSEKSSENADYVNAGYFVLNYNIISLIPGANCSWENEPLQTLASNKQLMSYKHNGFWRPMDTLRDKTRLEKLWVENKAPWKTWLN